MQVVFLIFQIQIGVTKLKVVNTMESCACQGTISKTFDHHQRKLKGIRPN